MNRYPIIISQSIYQYDDHVFVWFDEAGLVGGATNTLDQAQNKLKEYMHYTLKNNKEI